MDTTNQFHVPCSQVTKVYYDGDGIYTGGGRACILVGLAKIFEQSMFEK